MKTFFQDTSKLSVIVILGLLVVASSWSLLHPSFFRVHDFIHAARTAEMLRALQDGQFPVRWVGSFGYGYGMPLFQFYGPLPSYFSAAVYWLTGSIIFSVKTLFLVANIGTIWGAYRMGVTISNGDKRVGILAAALIGLHPYRAVNLFVRGAVSEAWGMMMIPWILDGAFRQLQNQSQAWKQTTLATAGLLLSHNLTSLMFLPLSGLMILIFAIFDRSRNSYKQVFKRVASVAGSYVLAVAMTSFYTLPSFFEKDFTKIDLILGGYFHYSQHFLYIRQFFQPNWGYGGSAWGPEDGISFFLGWSVFVGLFIIAILKLWLLAKDRSLKRFFTKQQLYAITLALFSAVTLFLTLQRSSSFWDQLTIMSFIQFPWRFLSITVVLLGLWIAVSLVEFAKIAKLSKMILHIMIGTVVFASLAHSIYFQPESYLDNPDALYYVDQERIAADMSGILPDYIPQTLPDEIEPPTDVLESNPQISEHTVLVDRSHQRLLTVTAESDTQVAFTIADFPGWRVELDGEPAIKRTSVDGRVTISVPQGSHQIGAYFGATPLRYWSDLISLLSLCFAVILGLKTKDESNSN